MATKPRKLTKDEFGPELRRLREQAHIAQQTLAAKLKVTHSYISQIETGVRKTNQVWFDKARAALKAIHHERDPLWPGRQTNKE